MLVAARWTIRTAGARCLLRGDPELVLSGFAAAMTFINTRDALDAQAHGDNSTTRRRVPAPTLVRRLRSAFWGSTPAA